MTHRYTIGLDFGTDSVRALLVDAADGSEISSFACDYPRWKKGLYSDPVKSQFRQHPLDYLEAMEVVLKGVISECPDKGAIVGISVDTTGSSPCLCDSKLVPLSMKEEHAEDPDAMFVIWKDHTGEKECDEIVSHCQGENARYLRHTGFAYSPENYWPKILHLVRTAPHLMGEAYTAVEFCDWIPAVLTGCDDAGKLMASCGVAGEKMMWAKEWGGYPPEEFFAGIDSGLVPILRGMQKENHGYGTPAGNLCREWAMKLGLGTDVVVGVGNIDSYSGAVGAGVSDGKMVMNLGTSACYLTVVPVETMKGRVVDGVFGQVEDMLLPGYDGFEVGLSAFGDAFAWVRRLLSWPLGDLLAGSLLKQGLSEDAVAKIRKDMEDGLLSALNKAAEALPVRVDAPLATDYFNGRRSPATNGALTASLANLRILSSAPEIYYAVVESTAFATKAILDYMSGNDVPVHSLVAVGGVAQKSPFVMQMMADVTGREIEVSGSKYAGALGAAMHAAVAAGMYDDVPGAQKAMASPVIKTYKPSAANKDILMARYSRYLDMARFTEDEMKK